MDRTDNRVKAFVKKNRFGLMVAAGFVVTVVVTNKAYINYLDRSNDLLAQNLDTVTNAILDRINSK